MDLFGSLTLLIALSPVLLIVLAVLAVTTRGKPFFSQERVGLCGRRFRMFKFRTMRLDAGKLQHLVQNEKDGPIFKNRVDPRITKLGRWLRKTSIDELPQLWNVLLGDMALVGPRPLLPEYLDRYTPEQARRHAVRPGLTGLAQVSGRNALTWAEKFELDVWYVDHRSLALDLRILCWTLRCVVGGRGIAAPGHASMPEFR